jgi:hypothetical protein
MDTHTQRGGGGAVLGSPRLWVVHGYTRSTTRAAVHARAATRVRRPGSPSRTIAAANPWRSHPTANNLSVMAATHSDWPRTRAPSSRVPNCLKRIADDVPTCAALVAPALGSVKQALDALRGAPRRRARLEIGVRWNPGSRRQSKRASAPNYESSRRLITCRATVDAITE